MQFLWFSWSCNLKSMKIWTPPMLRHLKFIVWSIIWALDQSFWLLELQVMTLQSGVPSQFWHFFNNLEKILSFFSFSSFASKSWFSWLLMIKMKFQLHFHDPWPKIPLVDQKSQKVKLCLTVDFLPNDPESSIFRGILWLWCDSHLIGTP